MKKALLLLSALIIAVLCHGQGIDAEMQKIFKKLEMRQQLTQAEQKKLEQWSEKMSQAGKLYNGGEEEEEYDDDLENIEDEIESPEQESGVQGNAAGSFTGQCPRQQGKTFIEEEITGDQYHTLVRELMTEYGNKLGSKLTQVRQMLQESAKPTDGADMAAIFHMSGWGAAAIYSAAWSAARAPQDILTANTLGVALKDMQEYTASLRVLNYADKLRPGIPVLKINKGWTCYEMGDSESAQRMFNEALRINPDLTAPHLGLGLIAECAGDHFTAMKHLRIALADSYSAAGFAAYRQARAASDAGGEDSSAEQETTPRDNSNTGGIQLPDLLVSGNPEGMMHMKPSIEHLMNGLDRRISRLTNDLLSASSTVRSQAAKAHANPDGALVFSRDYASEQMMLDDVTELLFGPNSNFGMAVMTGVNDCDRTMESVEDNLGTITQDMEKHLRLTEEKNRILEESIRKVEACGYNEPCAKKVAAETKAAIDPIDAELAQLIFRICKNTKRGTDMLIGCQSRYYKRANEAFRQAVYDYYAFTDPILERIYSPSYNEMLNLHRELNVLTHQKALAGTALSIADISEGYKSMVCVEPQPETPPKEAEEPELPEKKAKPCPLGDGIKGGFGGFSAELTCDHVTISGGKGLLGSVTRDFNAHQTKIWVGAGVKAEYAGGNVVGEATIGAEFVVGDNSTIEDIAFTSSVKTSLGDLVEAEVSGRISVEGGPQINTSAGLITPEIPGL